MSDFSAKIIAQLDTSKIPNELQKIEKETITLKNFTLETKNLVSQIENSLNGHKFKLTLDGVKLANVDNQMKTAGASAGNKFTSSFNSSLNKITVKRGMSEIANMQRTLKTLKFDRSSIDLITRDLNNMDITVGKIRTRMNNNGLTITVQGVDELGRAITVLKQFDSETGRISTAGTTINQSFKEATKSITDLQVLTLDNKMSKWLDKNSRAAKEFGGNIEILREKLRTAFASGTLSSETFKEIEDAFKGIDQQAEAVGKKGKSLGSVFKGAFESIFKYVSVSSVIYKSLDAFKQMYQNVYQIDTAMTELKKVTDEAASSYNKFLKGAGANAKEIGTTINGLINSTADFARLGFDLGESQELAKVANIYAVVGDEIESVDEATKSVISTMAAYNIEASESISIIDKFNKVGNTQAISSGGIGDALQNSASSLAAAGNSLDQSIALITAANKVVQNPDSVGTAFKTISMRIRSAKTE